MKSVKANNNYSGFSEVTPTRKASSEATAQTVTVKLYVCAIIKHT